MKPLLFIALFVGYALMAKAQPRDTLPQTKARTLVKNQTHAKPSIRKHKTTYVSAVPVDSAAWMYDTQHPSAHSASSERWTKVQKIQYSEAKEVRHSPHKRTSASNKQ